LVFGGLDARVAAPHAEFSALRNTRVTLLPAVGHSPPCEAPAVVAELIAHSLVAHPEASSQNDRSTTANGI
jgi:pimeloyl-ACP methyl ester carboxylesterase